MAHWLLKTEADSYSWDDLLRERETEWTGVRNHAAAAHLREMTVGDRAFFYHSGADKAVVGVCEVTRAAQTDGGDGPWVSVRVRPVEALARPVTLAAMKAEPALGAMATLHQSRLSVSPVTAAEWKVVLRLSQAPSPSPRT